MKKHLNQEILIIAIFTLLIVLFWIYKNVNNALDNPETPVVSKQEIQVLDPKLDSQVFDILENRQ